MCPIRILEKIAFETYVLHSLCAFCLIVIRYESLVLWTEISLGINLGLNSVLVSSARVSDNQPRSASVV